MDKTKYPYIKEVFVKVQKNGPSSLSVGLPKIIAENLRIQRGSYVMIYQSGDKIVIEKANAGGEW